MTVLNANVYFKRIKMVNFMLCEHYLSILRQENKNKIINLKSHSPSRAA